MQTVVLDFINKGLANVALLISLFILGHIVLHDISTSPRFSSEADH